MGTVSTPVRRRGQARCQSQYPMASEPLAGQAVSTPANLAAPVVSRAPPPAVSSPLLTGRQYPVFWPAPGVSRMPFASVPHGRAGSSPAVLRPVSTGSE